MVYKTESRILNLFELVETRGNPQKMDEAIFKGLVLSMKRKGFYLEPPSIWLRPDKKYQIISGHHRVKAAIKARIEKARCNVIVDSRYTKEQAMKDCIEANHRKGEQNEAELKSFIEEIVNDFDTSIEDIIEDIGIDKVDLDYLFRNSDKAIEEKVTLSPFEVDTIILEEIRKSDKILFSFSGGRDSSLAMVKMLPLVKDKDYEAIFVDTGIELLSVILHVIEFCDSYDIKLKILPAKNSFWDKFGKNKIFPDPIYKPCISLLISDTLDDYVKMQKERCLLVRGGRKKQTKRQMSGNVYGERELNKNTLLRLINPLYSVTDNEYNKEVKKIKIWDGYEKGFIRTACWCCPFQKEVQWEALKREYLGLWESMKIISKEWEFIYHAGDNYYKRFKKYWDKQI